MTDQVSSASPPDLQEFVDELNRMRADFVQALENAEATWNVAAADNPFVDFISPFAGGDDMMTTWKNRSDFVADVRQAFIEADDYDPASPGSVLTIPTVNVIASVSRSVEQLKALGVATDDAETIFAGSPELYDAVVTGVLSADQAVQLADLPPDVVRAVLDDYLALEDASGNIRTPDQVTAEIEAILTESADGSYDNDGFFPEDRLGINIQNYVDGLAAENPAEQALIARVMVEMGLRLQTNFDPDDDETYLERQAGTILATHGLRILPANQQNGLVDRLATEQVRGGPSLELLVDALQLDGEDQHSILSDHAVGPGFNQWSANVQAYYRQHLFDRLISSTIDGDGTISPAGQRTVNYFLDSYPDVVSQTDNNGVVGQQGTNWSGDSHPIFDLRATVGTALAAANYALNNQQYAASQRINEIDALVTSGDLTDDEFNDLWLEQKFRVLEAANQSEEQAVFVRNAMAQGLRAADAARIGAFASTPEATNDRVRRVRVVYETDPMGHPSAPGSLSVLNVADHVAQSLYVELTVLQAVQESRYIGDVSTELPLTHEQIGLISDYALYDTWVHHVGGWAGPVGGHSGVLQMIADGQWQGADPPEGLQGLAVQLLKPENQDIWHLMAGASENDTFLGGGGRYQPNKDRNGIVPGDAQALIVQMTLTSRVGPLFDELDISANGQLHENEIDSWLTASRNNPDVPPSLVDAIETGREFGLGQDTFGWDQFAEIVGWVALGAAATASIVYSGGATTPLWVKAGLFGLAATEEFAYTQADDPTNPSIAGLGGFGDLATTAQLIGNGYTFQTDDLGRPISAQGELVLAHRGRTAEQTRTGSLVQPGDQGGHLIGHQLDGPTDAFNLIPQSIVLNRGRASPWAAMEKHWADALSQVPPQQVVVNVEPVFLASNATARPNGFQVSYTIDGIPTTEYLNNL